MFGSRKMAFCRTEAGTTSRSGGASSSGCSTLNLTDDCKPVADRCGIQRGDLFDVIDLLDLDEAAPRRRRPRLREVPGGPARVQARCAVACPCAGRRSRSPTGDPSCEGAATVGLPPAHPSPQSPRRRHPLPRRPRTAWNRTRSEGDGSDEHGEDAEVRGARSHAQARPSPKRACGYLGHATGRRDQGPAARRECPRWPR